MSVLKPVKRALDLRVGKKYVDVKHRRVVIVDNILQSSGIVECHDVDDEDDITWLSFKDVHNELRELNLSTLDLQVLLCGSMIEFIELMLTMNYKGGEEDDGTKRRND